MRIVSGTHKGRNISPPTHLPVRPTTDFAKESLFNILYNYMDFEGMQVLDLFAGTGNISYEFASRGCSKVWAVENNIKCFNFITQCAEKLKFTAIHPVQANVFSFLKMHRDAYDIIFADPPYELANIQEIPDLIFENNMLKEEGWLILEHSKANDFSSHPKLFQHREYGKVNFSFFVNNL